MRATTPSLDEIARTYGPLVSSVCWRMTRDEERAREAAQEAWVEIVRALPSFAGRARLSTWIFQIVWRAVWRFTREERRHSIAFLKAYFSGPDLPAPEVPDPERDRWVRSMCDKCLAGTLQCLEPEARLAYLLRDVAELEHAEIARVLGLAEDAVRQSISRARRKLRAFLTGQCALQNPAGSCRCRMRRHVDAVQLPAEYARLRRTARVARLYKESETLLPSRNFWLGL